MGSRTKATGCILLNNMKVISAYMLAVVGGNASPSADDVKKILNSVGVELSGDESGALDSLISSLSERSLDDVLAEGNALIATCPGGGSGGGGGGGGDAVAASAGGEQAAAKKKTTTEEDDDMAAAPAADLFGGGDDY